MKNILIAPNAFKECADQIEVTALISANFIENKFRSTAIPLTDGGDGFLDVCVEKFDLLRKTFTISTPDNSSKMRTEYGINRSSTVAYIESAKVLGLKVIHREGRNPMLFNSKGLGELLQQIIHNYNPLKKIIIGIGGTGTNDFGLGMASVFGLRLVGENKNDLEVIPQNYNLVEDLLWEQRNFSVSIEVIADIDNPLLGEFGSTKTFAAQKGASEKEIEVMENGFNNIYKRLKTRRIVNSLTELNGAGGGLAAGLQIFFNADIKYSSEFILQDLGIRDHARDDEVIITGEGSFDSQSLMNKASGFLIDYYMNTGAKVFIICGKAEDSIIRKLPGNVHVVEMLKFFKSEEESIKGYKAGISLACDEIKKVIFEN